MAQNGDVRSWDVVLRSRERRRIHPAPANSHESQVPQEEDDARSSVSSTTRRAHDGPTDGECETEEAACYAHTRTTTTRDGRGLQESKAHHMLIVNALDAVIAAVTDSGHWMTQPGTAPLLIALPNLPATSVVPDTASPALSEMHAKRFSVRT